jgi:protein-disulfide isomerase
MNNNNRAAILGGIIGLVVIVAGVAILLTTRSGAGQGARFDYDSIPQTVTDDGAYVLGDPAAPITIVEFADFMCPHCQDYTDTIDRVIEEHVLTGNAKFEFRMFPTTDRTAITFRLLECSTQQDEAIFYPAHDVLFDLTKAGWGQTSSQEFANRLGLNYGELLNCISDANQWQIDAQLGQRSGVTGTPAVRIRLADGPLQPISEQYIRSGPSYQVIASTVNAANQ